MSLISLGTDTHTARYGTELMLGRADRAMKRECTVGRHRADETRGQCVLQAEAAVQFVNVCDQLCAAREREREREGECVRSMGMSG